MLRNQYNQNQTLHNSNSNHIHSHSHNFNSQIAAPDQNYSLLNYEGQDQNPPRNFENKNYQKIARAITPQLGRDHYSISQIKEQSQPLRVLNLQQINFVDDSLRKHSKLNTSSLTPLLSGQLDTQAGRKFKIQNRNNQEKYIEDVKSINVKNLNSSLKLEKKIQNENIKSLLSQIEGQINKIKNENADYRICQSNPKVIENYHSFKQSQVSDYTDNFNKSENQPKIRKSNTFGMKQQHNQSVSSSQGETSAGLVTALTTISYQQSTVALKSGMNSQVVQPRHHIQPSQPNTSIDQQYQQLNDQQQIPQMRQNYHRRAQSSLIAYPNSSQNSGNTSQSINFQEYDNAQQTNPPQFVNQPRDNSKERNQNQANTQKPQHPQNIALGSYTQNYIRKKEHIQQQQLLNQSLRPRPNSSLQMSQKLYLQNNGQICTKIHNQQNDSKQKSLNGSQNPGHQENQVNYAEIMLQRQIMNEKQSQGASRSRSLQQSRANFQNELEINEGNINQNKIQQSQLPLNLINQAKSQNPQKCNISQSLQPSPKNNQSRQLSRLNYHNQKRLSVGPSNKCTAQILANKNPLKIKLRKYSKILKGTQNNQQLQLELKIETNLNDQRLYSQSAKNQGMSTPVSSKTKSPGKQIQTQLISKFQISNYIALKTKDQDQRFKLQNSQQKKNYEQLSGQTTSQKKNQIVSRDNKRSRSLNHSQSYLNSQSIQKSKINLSLQQANSSSNIAQNYHSKSLSRKQFSSLSQAGRIRDSILNRSQSNIINKHLSICCSNSSANYSNSKLSNSQIALGMYVNVHHNQSNSKERKKVGLRHASSSLDSKTNHKMQQILRQTLKREDLNSSKEFTLGAPLNKSSTIKSLNKNLLSFGHGNQMTTQKLQTCHNSPIRYFDDKMIQVDIPVFKHKHQQLGLIISNYSDSLHFSNSQKLTNSNLTRTLNNNQTTAQQQNISNQVHQNNHNFQPQVQQHHQMNSSLTKFPQNSQNFDLMTTKSSNDVAAILNSSGFNQTLTSPQYLQYNHGIQENPYQHQQKFFGADITRDSSLRQINQVSNLSKFKKNQDQSQMIKSSQMIEHDSNNKYNNPSEVEQYINALQKVNISSSLNQEGVQTYTNQQPKINNFVLARNDQQIEQQNYNKSSTAPDITPQSHLNHHNLSIISFNNGCNNQSQKILDISRCDSSSQIDNSCLPTSSFDNCEGKHCSSVEIINTRTLVSRNNKKFEVYQYQQDDTHETQQRQQQSPDTLKAPSNIQQHSQQYLKIPSPKQQQSNVSQLSSQMNSRKSYYQQDDIDNFDVSEEFGDTQKMRTIIISNTDNVSKFNDYRSQNYSTNSSVNQNKLNSREGLKEKQEISTQENIQEINQAKRVLEKQKAKQQILQQKNKLQIPLALLQINSQEIFDKREKTLKEVEYMDEMDKSQSYQYQSDLYSKRDNKEKSTQNEKENLKLSKARDKKLPSHNQPTISSDYSQILNNLPSDNGSLISINYEDIEKQCRKFGIGSQSIKGTVQTQQSLESQRGIHTFQSLRQDLNSSNQEIEKIIYMAQQQKVKNSLINCTVHEKNEDNQEIRESNKDSKIYYNKIGSHRVSLRDLQTTQNSHQRNDIPRFDKGIIMSMEESMNLSRTNISIKLGQQISKQIRISKRGL